MLHELVVDNLGVIGHAQVLLGPGVTALTGETGAGKTLVTEAINLLLGGRADPALVRPGADQAEVQGRFVLADDTEVTVRRVIPATGRSRAYLNGSLATAAVLAETVGPLVEVHGQHGQQAMLRTVPKREALDRFGNHDLGPLAQAQAALGQAQARLGEFGGDEFARAREIELLHYQVDEIDAAAISGPDEDAELANTEEILGDAQGHREAAERALEILSADGSAGEAIGDALAALRDRSPFQTETARLYDIQADIGDIVESLRAQTESIEADPARLAELQTRREVLSGLRRKYGAELAAVISFADQARARLTELENHTEMADKLTAEIEKLEMTRAAAAAELVAARVATAESLADRVQAELRELALPSARFEIRVDGEAGEAVDFHVAMNPGSAPMALAKVASGGELSRVMLALQLVVGGDTGTVVFDEVDAGVGGEAAGSIGRALSGVGSDCQVLVVTHLPQVAAFADRQINIHKTTDGSTAATELSELDEAGRIIELARMLSGSPDSESARAHAAELLGSARS